MRKAQKYGLRKVKANSDRQKLMAQYRAEIRKDKAKKWQDPSNFSRLAIAESKFKGYKTPAQIKARHKKMKGKKVKAKNPFISSLWS